MYMLVLGLIVVLHAVSEDSHIHRVSDIRHASVEITAVGPQGVDYADIEENTVGPDNHLALSEDFAMFELTQVQEKKGTYIKMRPLGRGLRKGDTGVITYCGVCKRAISFKIVTTEPGGVFPKSAA